MSNKSNKENTNLLVIGNGFDMFLGLNSSFKEFFGLNNSKYGIYTHLYNDIHAIKNHMESFDNYVGNSNVFNDYQLDSQLVLKYVDSKWIRTLMYKTGHNFLYNGKELSMYDIKDIDHNIENFDDPNISFISYKDKPSFSYNHINFWAIYLILKKDNGDMNWSNIESEIYDFLSNKNLRFYIIADFFILYY